MSETAKDVDLMRPSLQEIFSGSLKNPHAGLLLQRGLKKYDAASEKPTKSDLIKKISAIQISTDEKNLYYKAYQRWKKITSDEQRFAVTAAKIVGRLYTGLSSATALETGLTTHHTYGMPMLAGSSVKGATASYAEKIGITLQTHPEVYRVLFGDEEKAGAVIWHDAWWIPNGKPFVGEIITTHHQHYYKGKDDKGKDKITADEMEDPMPNQQIACQGSFYFVVECGNKAWADFANQLLFEMLQNQGMGSKTASGYGYFTVDETEQNRLNAQREKQAQQRAEEEKAEELAAMSEHERLVAEWLETLDGKKYTANDAEGSQKYAAFKSALEKAHADFDLEQQKWIAEKLAFKSVLQAKQPKWLEGKREKEIKELLKQLRGE